MFTHKKNSIILLSCVVLFIYNDFECEICRKYDRRYPNFKENTFGFYLLIVASAFSIIQIILFLFIYCFYIKKENKVEKIKNNTNENDKREFQQNQGHINEISPEISSQATLPNQIETNEDIQRKLNKNEKSAEKESESSSEKNVNESMSIHETDTESSR